MTSIAEHGSDPLAEAGAWVARLQGSEITEDDGLAFEAWLAAAPGNAAAYRRALSVWHEFDRAAADVLDELETPAVHPLSARRGPNRRWWMAGGVGSALAAGLAVALLPGLLAPTVQATYATGKGEHQHVTLADGSVLDINAETRLSVRLTRSAREITLAEGEAIFDVAHDARRPFTVAAGDRLIRDVGTQFDVKRRDGALSVTVAQGVVEVRPVAATAKLAAYRLTPGERLAVTRTGAVQVAAVDPNEALGWRAGRLVYREQPLSDVVADLNRQFVTQIEIGDPELGKIPITGVIVLDDQASVVSRLSLMLPVRSVGSDRGLVLLRK